VLAVFALAGCGGGSSEGQTTAASSAPANKGTTAATPGATQGNASADAKAGASADSGPGQGEGTPGEQRGGAGSPGQAGQKQGPPIAQPKGPPEQGATPSEVANATIADIKLESYSPFTSATGEPASLPTNYSCDGEDKWPQFHWSGVPAGTAELALYAMNVQPVEGKLFVDWAVAGLDPSLGEIVSGKLPKGAVVGTNGFGKRGYSICPEGRGEIYMFALYALPKHLALSPGFDGREARGQILAVSGNVGLLPMLYAHH
jgi:phosphatidylethanolamine-binding protein (PEBP) family uncharacterized protein